MKQVLACWGSRTLCLSLHDDACARDLLSELHDREGIPLEDVWLQREGHALAADADLQPEDKVWVCLRLRGGKGGFGSMLRFLGSQRSGAETDNIDACRDLSGRRLKHVQDEKKIAEWMAKSEERQKEKELKKLMKRERKMATPKHTFDHHKLVVELHEKAKSIEESVAEGLKRAESLSNSAAPATASAGKAKRLCIREEWEDEVSSSSSGSSSGDESASEDGKKSAAKVTSPSTAAASSSASSSSSVAPTAATPAAPAAAAAAGSASSVAPSKQNAAASTNQPPQQQQQPPQTNGKSHADINGKTGKDTGKDTKAATAAAADAKPKPDVQPEELDLTPFKSAQELESVGLDRLKAALMFLGVKCGGTLEQRAERLFSLKGVPTSKIPANLLAKK